MNEYQTSILHGPPKLMQQLETVFLTDRTILVRTMSS